MTYNYDLLSGLSQDKLKTYPNNYFDFILTDPPYGLEFMSKDWDKVLPPIEVWRECYRVLKPGAFAFIMATPRQDLLSKLIYQLHDLRSETELFFKRKRYSFKTGVTSLYWAYAQGFNKSSNTAKMIDKRLGVYDKREKFLKSIAYPDSDNWGIPQHHSDDTNNTESSYNLHAERINAGEGMRVDSKAYSEEAKLLEGSYLGFQPKPALEPIIVVQKPIIFKNMISQAQAYAEATLKGEHVAFGPSVTWLDNGRIPTKDNIEYIWSDKTGNGKFVEHQYEKRKGKWENSKGRVPGNLLISDSILDNGELTQGKHHLKKEKGLPLFGKVFQEKGVIASKYDNYGGFDDEGDFSRYFDLDYWFEERIAKYMPKTFPFLVVPKPSVKEKELGTEQLDKKMVTELDKWINFDERKRARGILYDVEGKSFTAQPRGNFHPTSEIY